jgi:NTE family protein
MFHLAMKGSVQSKIDSCLYIEPPNMSHSFNLKRADEIFDYGISIRTFENRKELNL